MEILQTIWTALTTENEMLVKIINIPLIFIEMYVSMLLFINVLNIKVSKKQEFLYVLILGIIGLITNWVIPYPYGTFINIISYPILVYFLFKTNILKSILAEIIPYIFFIVISSILITLSVNLSNIDSVLFLQIPLYKLIFSLILYFLIYLINCIFKHFKFSIKWLDNIKRSNNPIIFFNFIIGIIAISFQAYIFAIYVDKLSISIMLSSLISLLLYFSISIYSLSRTTKLESTTEELEEEKLYNKTLNILYDNIRGFKHDFGNIVQAIGGYISTNNIDGLKEYYSDLMLDCQKVNNLAILNPEVINNPAVYSLLTSKYHKAEALDIKINFEVFLDLSNLNIKSYELSRILGILLDNAIEASSECDEKEINIIIRNDSKVNRKLFIIENTYKNKDVNIDRIFEKGYTSKNDDKKNHGLGLWEVRKILKKNNNLNLFTTKDNKLFKQQLEIYNS